ncbi:amino acid ABC transporter substrate-binding protein [Bosea sp. ANAM02]|uniref:amino acid ABC transporter substrate-binding protein n=1 Tax=Bosea sp. ANAM02 TaxID=2020412 RepID=UPI00140EEF57|nr:amino acid ABC transporter substrate-binding protein [Bosea sp. ANAM02]BCB19969.1 amino acid ABC transporter substrate-binding protein [Bosea sp. ANAM02]
MLSLAAMALATFAIIVPASGRAAPEGGLLEQVRRRGAVICGVAPSLAGFSIPDREGRWTGFDVDLCRAVAAAIFDDPEKVRFVPLLSKDRFTALQTGEVDLLSRTSTWSMARDTALGLNFTGINFYGGEGFMVRRKLGLNSALELAGASVCVEQGTTTELNVADFFRGHGLKYEIVAFKGSEETVDAYASGRCDAFAYDRSGLAIQRMKLATPEEHVILPETISKEPLGPAVRHGDDQWFDLVKWTLFAMLNAEEMGVGQSNAAAMRASERPDVRRLLGIEGDFGEALGLDRDWAYRILRHVGNYGESFERNLGRDSPLKIERGQNALWTRGGLQYAPPIR